MSGAKQLGIGAVAIGRNEGERLRRCLESLIGPTAPVVYVDSGSSDGSVALARTLGAEVVELDLLIPFTAARARNAGLARLVALQPALELVQFVDGDCEVNAGWLERAAAEFERQPMAAVVCGRRRERHPDASVYNRLCDLEWDTPVGEARACGGDALMRVAAVRAVGGYNDAMIAGEEPELCVRLRLAGWSIQRIDAEMTLHDAGLTRFGQWWKRALRAGHAYAEGAWLHGRGAMRHNRAAVQSALLWGLLVPLAALGLAWLTFGLSLLAWFGLAALQGARVSAQQRRRGRSNRDAALYATFVQLGKFAQVCGILLFAWRRLARRPARLIEYKGVSSGAVPSGAPQEATFHGR